jgi:hypothetical protein
MSPFDSPLQNLLHLMQYLYIFKCLKLKPEFKIEFLL